MTAAWALLAMNDDRYNNFDYGVSFDSHLRFLVPSSDIYSVVVFGSGAAPQANPFNSASGGGTASEGTYDLTILLENPNIIASSKNNDYYPDASPLPRDGNATLSYVINSPGRYAMSVLSGSGAYTLQLRDFRPAFEQPPVYSHQILYLDFNGANINAAEVFYSSFGGAGNPDAHLSPFSSFLSNWELGPDSENALIDAIVARVVDLYAHDVSGVVGQGLNGDFTITDRAGDFQIEILNSRDHADPFGLYPNVSRVIVGGTLAELDSPVTFIGLAPSIDVGNFETAETAVALLDNLFNLDTVPLAPGKTVVDYIGVFIGELVAHEAGHFFGNWHTAQTTPNSIMSGFISRATVVGPNGIFGTADDPDRGFERTSYSAQEGFLGTEDTLNTIAFGLSTGTKAGTYFDFVTGTLYVTGNIDDGHKDELEIKNVGSNGSDLLIGARTAFDTVAVALSAVLAEWSSPRSYQNRIANLRGTGSGARSNGNTFLKLSGSNATVFDDSDQDNLTGGSGRDWFFAHLTGNKKDKVHDLDDNELLEKLL